MAADDEIRIGALQRGVRLEMLVRAHGEILDVAGFLNEMAERVLLRIAAVGGGVVVEREGVVDGDAELAQVRDEAVGEGRARGDEPSLALERLSQPLEVRRDAGALGGDHRLDPVLAPGDAGDVSQPAVGRVEPVGQGRANLRHAVFLLEPGREIGQHEAHGDRRGRGREIGEALERTAAHHQIDPEAERVDQRREHVRAAEVDDVEKVVALLMPSVRHEPAQDAVLDHVPAGRPVARLEALAIERHNRNADLRLELAGRAVDVVADHAGGAGGGDEDDARGVPLERLADGVGQPVDAAEHHVAARRDWCRSSSGPRASSRGAPRGRASSAR